MSVGAGAVVFVADGSGVVVDVGGTEVAVDVAVDVRVAVPVPAAGVFVAVPDTGVAVAAGGVVAVAVPVAVAVRVAVDVAVAVAVGVAGPITSTMPSRLLTVISDPPKISEFDRFSGEIPLAFSRACITRTNASVSPGFTEPSGRLRNILSVPLALASAIAPSLVCGGVPNVMSAPRYAPPRRTSTIWTSAGSNVTSAWAPIVMASTL